MLQNFIRSTQLLFLFSLLLLISTNSLTTTSNRGCGDIDLMKYPHMRFLPNLQRSNGMPAPTPRGYDFCGLKETCCASYQLLATKAAYMELSFYLDAIKSRIRVLLDNNDDLFLLLEALLQKSIPEQTFNQDLRNALQDFANNSKRNPYRLMVQNLLNLLNDVLGYLSVLSCSVCDPRSVDYFVKTEVNIKLQIKYDFLQEFMSDFTAFITSFVSLVKNEKLKESVIELLYQICKQTEPILSVCTFDDYVASYETFLSLFGNEHQLHQLFCAVNEGSQKGCEDFISQNLFQGLAVFLNPVRDNVVRFLINRCPNDWLRCIRGKNALKQIDFNRYLNLTAASVEKRIENEYLSDRAHIRTGTIADLLKESRSNNMLQSAFQKENFLHSSSPNHTGLTVVRIFFLLTGFGLISYGMFYFYRKSFNSDQGVPSFYNALG